MKSNKAGCSPLQMKALTKNITEVKWKRWRECGTDGSEPSCSQCKQNASLSSELTVSGSSRMKIKVLYPNRSQSHQNESYFTDSLHGT